jgi:RNA polymerase sigma factor (sigma-70 family)
MDDHELLRQYVQHRSQQAFAELTRRHIDLVYSTALRLVRDRALAEDITQLVFLQLACKARFVRAANALPGWLYHVTRCQAANVIRAERTRRRHETEATLMANLNRDSSVPPSVAWNAIAPQLETAMGRLSRNDQTAIVLRYFQGQSWRQVGDALAISEEAAQKRVGRALEKLRAHVSRPGTDLSASVLAAALAAHAVHAAPAGLASSVAAASLAQAATLGSGTLLTALLQGILMKKAVLIALATVLVVVAFSVPMILSHRPAPPAVLPQDGPTVAPADTPSAMTPVPPPPVPAPAVTSTPVAAPTSPATAAEGWITDASIRQGLVLHFTFDREDPRGSVADTSPMGNNGTVKNAHWTPDGKKGGAYEFRADNEMIQVPNSDSLNPPNLSVAAWIKGTFTDANWRRILDKSWDEGFALGIAGDYEQNAWRGKASMEIANQGARLSKDVVMDGQWHLLVATYDGLNNSLYVDGRLNARSRSRGRVPPTPYPLTIGCNGSTPPQQNGDSFRGLIDEPMIWNRALSEAEALYLFDPAAQHAATMP